MARAVPYAAYPSGELVLPDQATTGQPYVCLQCKEPVSFRREHLRRGGTVEAHFSHRPGTECAGESVTHIAAKIRLQEALSRKEQPFVLRRTCARLGCSVTLDQPWFPEPYDVAAVEVALHQYRLDVATLQGGEVVTGFEVFHSHRIGTAKAAGLSVPWLELQAEATARDPYVLQPVLESQLTGAEDDSLRMALRVTRARLADSLTMRLESGELLTQPHNLRAVPHHLICSIFQSHLEQTSFLDPWRCPACAEAWGRHQAELERYEAARREQERQAEQTRLEQQAAAEIELVRQREVFGPRLRASFSSYEVKFFERSASTLRFAWRYVPQPLKLAAHFRRFPDDVLIARRCWKCAKPMLCVDTSGWMPEFRAYYPMIEYFKPEEGRRGYFISKCLHCGSRQRFRQQREGAHIVLTADHMVQWLEAFGD
ncbi:hypothetical protein [Deinococcus sp. AJ005]|uniref:hypothetical protein n=1 Tax=Deinococcus sp. AJ005 TaxID=2652443 RepID=UPI00125CB475|nr:hypothetical protein [Deinococcus sp. AJ005]QFP78560.1 hypothetical protein DAAJ005_18490 [Deinococcus sp. AJ005]